MRLRLLSTLLLLSSSLSYAQTQTVSGSATDSDSQKWFGGTYKIEFFPNPNYPNIVSYFVDGSTPLSTYTLSFKGVLDINGAFSQTGIVNSNRITPTGSKWKFYVCPQASDICGDFTIPVTADADVTSTISTHIKAPRFAAVAGAFGYNDLEAQPTPLVAGATYWSVTQLCQEYYTNTIWACAGVTGAIPPSNTSGLAGHFSYYATNGTTLSDSQIWVPVFGSTDPNVSGPPCNLAHVTQEYYRQAVLPDISRSVYMCTAVAGPSYIWVPETAVPLTTASNFFVPAAGGSWSVPPALDATGVADNSGTINGYLAAQGNEATASLSLPPGTFYTPSLSNSGVRISGSGVLLKSVNQIAPNSSSVNVTATKAQQNSYAYSPTRITFGQEYMSRWSSLVQAGSAAKVIFSGDSTTAGNNVSAPFTVDQMFLSSATAAGLTNITVVNAGHVGKTSTDWLSTYLATDLAANPDVYVIRWCLNDAFFSGTPTQCISNIRSGLTTIRASKSVDQLTIVLETPSSTNDNPNGRSPLFYEQIRSGLAQAARDFQAVFIDLYGYLPDNDFTVQTCMMDLPYSGSGASIPDIHIHPGNCKNPIYNNILAKTLIEPYNVPTAFLSKLPNTFPGNGIYMGNSAVGGGLQFFTNQAAGANLKYWQIWEDSFGTLTWSVVNDAVSVSNVAFRLLRNSTPMGIGAELDGEHPCFALGDLPHTTILAFFGNYQGVAQLGTNRNPCTGIFSDVTQTAATIQLNPTSAGTSSNMQVYASTAANSAPSLVSTTDATGMNLPAGETYKINGVPIGGAYTLPAQYQTLSCQGSFGDGLNAITAGTYPQILCANTTGVTANLSGFKCFSDNAGTSTINFTNGAGTGLLTGAITCSIAGASGTQSATVTLASGDVIKISMVPDGTSKRMFYYLTASY